MRGGDTRCFEYSNQTEMKKQNLELKFQQIEKSNFMY